MKYLMIGCTAACLLAGGTQLGAKPPTAGAKNWSQETVDQLAALPAAERRAALKAMDPAERQGLWFAVKRQVRANQGIAPAVKSQDSLYRGTNAGANAAQGTNKSKGGVKAGSAVGTIVYDDGTGSTTFGGGAIIGNRFNTHTGIPVFANGQVDTVEAVVVPGGALTTSSAGFVILGPQTGGGGAQALASSFTTASGATDTVSFNGLGVAYTGSSFFVLFGDFAQSYVPVFDSGTNLGQGHHGVVGYTGGMGPNITSTFDFGGTLNGLVRAGGNIVPVELMQFSVD